MIAAARRAAVAAQLFSKERTPRNGPHTWETCSAGSRARGDVILINISGAGHASGHVSLHLGSAGCDWLWRIGLPSEGPGRCIL